MNRLLRQMAPNNEDGTKRVALWALSSTCLPKRDIAAAVADFADIGYACRESHGVRGDKREEIAGVMICIDPKQLRLLRFTADGRDRRVIRTGRALRVRLGVVGSEDRSTDFDAIVAYMLVRGSGAGSGHTSGAARRMYNEAVWKHLAVSAMPLANRGRLLLMGDMNAETRAALRQRSRQQHASDAALHHLLDLSRMAPLHHERDWTYTDASRSYFSTIDYIILVTGCLKLASLASRADGHPFFRCGAPWKACDARRRAGHGRDRIGLASGTRAARGVS
jgi:hypothetical protein